MKIVFNLRCSISTLLLVLSCLMADAQDINFDSHIFLANHTPLTFEAESRVAGATYMVEAGTDMIFPWENGHYHDLNDRILVTLLNIVFNVGIDHKEETYLQKFDRFSFSGDQDFDIEIDIRHNGNLLFTIVVRLNDRNFDLLNPVYYHVRFPNQENDVETPYNMLSENGNAPHAANREIFINDVSHTLIYGSVEDDTDPTNNLIFSISETEPVSFAYDPVSVDAADVNVLNVLTYNIGLLMPLMANDQEELERVPVIHQAMPKNMDIIVWQEMFETFLVNRIIDSMSVDYPYHTSPHNQEVIPGLTKNGGVLIMSKHPILEEGDFSFEDDGGITPFEESVFADKGVKYAKIDKHGQIIHVFGSHTSSQAVENDAMGRFINETIQPNRNEIVVMGGDMNTRNYTYQYLRMLDSLHALEPTYLTNLHPQPETRGTTWGFNHYSSGRNDPARTIDYLFCSEDFKVPVVYTNEAMAYRLSIANPSFWGIFDLGDHQPVYARFEFPGMQSSVDDTVLCPGDDLAINITTSLEDYDVFWYKNGELLANEQLLQLNRIDITDDDYGLYRCELHYTYAPDSTVNDVFDGFSIIEPYTFPGLKTGVLSREYSIIRDNILCGIPTALHEDLALNWKIFPNPVSSELVIRRPMISNPAHKVYQGEVAIFNIMGAEVHRALLAEQILIDVSEWPSGIYWLDASSHGVPDLRTSFIKR